MSNRGNHAPLKEDPYGRQYYNLAQIDCIFTLIQVLQIQIEPNITPKKMRSVPRNQHEKSIIMSMPVTSCSSPFSLCLVRTAVVS